MGPERNPEISEGGWSPHPKSAIPKIGERDCTKAARGPKTTEFHSSDTARGWWSLPSGPYGASQFVCNPCKKSDYYAMRHTTGPQNLGRFLSEKKMKRYRS